MKITPEAYFVTLSARESDAAQPEALRSAAAAVRDWDAVVATAARHRVVRFVQEAATRGAIPLDAKVEEALSNAAIGALASVMLLRAQLLQVIGALALAKVPVIVLKGPVLARTIYPDAALRPYDDIDLTVQDRHEEAAAAALRGCGLTETPYAAWHDHAGRAHVGVALHRNFVLSGGQVLIELHAEPLQLGLKPNGEAGRWQRAVPVPQLPGALMLCPEDQLLQLSVHAHKHGYSRLIWLKDLDLLLRVYGDRLDWDLVVRVARQEGVQASIWYSLRLAGELLGTPVPRPVLARLCPVLPLRILYSVVWPTARIAGLDGHMRRNAVQFHAEASWVKMVPSLILMGRRHDRVRAIAQSVVHR